MSSAPAAPKPAQRRTRQPRRVAASAPASARAVYSKPAPAEYARFLANKRVLARPCGFTADSAALNPLLYPFQRAIVVWALQRGRAALFCECGTGKTLMQLAWAEQVCRHSEGNVLILAPLAVAQQTQREGAKFGVPVTVCRTQADVRPGINITNYEMLAHFDATRFTGVVLDESAILRNYMGKTKQALLAAFAATPYKLACTATPAPNDHMELGNHAEFLGVMRSTEMLTRWFINDTMAVGNYRLKGHAEKDFWEWVASWAISLRRPSDLGYPDDGYVLPPLHLRHETVEVDLTIDREDGQLFRTPTLNATTMHREMRRTAKARAARVAALVNNSNTDVWAVWCNTNYEADELVRRIPDAIEVRGTESITAKEAKLNAFLEGRARVLITKPGIAGHGLNMQHCHRTAFVGLSYNFEEFYQAVRRFYRFGQTQPVEAVVVAAETEGPVLAAIERKMRDHDRMLDAMVASTAKLALAADRQLVAYDPHLPMMLPTWLRPQLAEERKSA